MNQETSNSTSFYTYLFNELADPRTNSWYLINDPVLTLSILVLYLYFVLSWGPRFMEDRPPYQFKKCLVIYNLLQVSLSTWIFWEIIRGVYIYFLAKMSELLDTVFFVLRKKNHQVTFLHVYHHTAMPMISWGATKYFPGGHGAIVGIINSFVHIFMYTYYLMAALGPKYRRFLWWKKYLTILQMVQFAVAFLHNSQLLFVDCGYPRWSVIFTLPNAVFFYILFSDFYRKNYSNDKRILMAKRVKKRTKSDLEVWESCDKK